MKVLKFGGTSVRDAEQIRVVIGILQEAARTHDTLAVVASAMAGVTDQLIIAGQRAFRGDSGYHAVLDELERRHRVVADTLLGSGLPTPAHRFIEQAFQELHAFVQGIWILGELTPRTLDYVMSYGEQLSCTILAEALSLAGLDAHYVDGRRLIRTDLGYGHAEVNFDLTNWNLVQHFHNKKGIHVITGFIACGPDNEITTLGRGGSDYTASIVGAALEAPEIEIWTDVSGVLTADPRKVPQALSLPSLTFEEALELSHFGAKVIHPPTMLPALKKRIPIRIRNTFDTGFAGTLISDRKESTGDSRVKGIACLENISLLRVTGEGILRTAGIAARIFAGLARKDIEVKLVTQSSSEHSVCLAIARDQVRLARETLELEFRVELHHGQLSALTVEDDCSIVAVVGEQVHNLPGVTVKIFEALGRNGITPRAIAHGSSARILTIALRQSDLGKAMNALHDNLFLSREKTVNLFLLGPGLVGSEFLDLLREQEEYARESLRTRFRVLGIANSRQMLFDPRGIDLVQWRERLSASPLPSDLDAFTTTVRNLNAANSIVLDLTGSEKVVGQYLAWLGASISVITSSKVANTRSQEFYWELRTTAAQHGALFRYSTNVGAALPIIESIRSIIQNGDVVERIEAVLSGSLSFIFNSVNGGASFSEAVRGARQRGFTEPDPRIDLCGLDVARKLVILMREAGIQIELDALEIEPAMPGDLLAMPDLESALGAADAELDRRRSEARTRGCSLLFVAQYVDGRAKIGIQEIGASHPFANLAGNDNIVSLTTRTLYRQPLVVRGGGAGARLTAAGVFNDIVHVSNSMQ